MTLIRNIRMKLFRWLWVPVLVGAVGCGSSALVREGLVLDLDAERGVKVTDGDRVVRWVNQVPGAAARVFEKRDRGRERKGSGRPGLRTSVKDAGGHDVIVFHRQELVNHREDAFDHLIHGSGYTWVAVLAPLKQKKGLEDVNSIFGNLRNGGNFEGFWAGFNDDNSIWMGTRNGLTFGRWDENNPKVTGPRLETGQFYVVAGRMEEGTGTVGIDLFVNGARPVASGTVPIHLDVDPSKMVIGQERDAVEHPGRESFDGMIARFLVYERPLGKEEFERVLAVLKKMYRLDFRKRDADGE